MQTTGAFDGRPNAYAANTLPPQPRRQSHDAGRPETDADPDQSSVERRWFSTHAASSLKSKHVEVLLTRWKAEGLASGTIKNRMAVLRWWAEKIGRAGLIPADNDQLAIPRRALVTNENKARQLGNNLEHVTDPYARMSLELQQQFGLRREECIKFQPRYADRGDHIEIKGSWAKGGRSRRVPITTAGQRATLDASHRVAGPGSLIPSRMTYIEQRNAYDGQCKAVGLSNMHGLRHLYAQTRYEALTGWKAPTAGGPAASALTAAQRAQDAVARQAISRELGHERPQITAIYLGR